MAAESQKKMQSVFDYEVGHLTVSKACIEVELSGQPCSVHYTLHDGQVFGEDSLTLHHPDYGYVDMSCSDFFIEAGFDSSPRQWGFWTHKKRLSVFASFMCFADQIYEGGIKALLDDNNLWNDLEHPRYKQWTALPF